jgi:hypothetical protein
MLMGRIYEVYCCDGLRRHDIHTKFHKAWLRHSKVKRVEGSEAQIYHGHHISQSVLLKIRKLV